MLWELKLSTKKLHRIASQSYTENPGPPPPESVGPEILGGHSLEEMSDIEIDIFREEIL